MRSTVSVEMDNVVHETQDSVQTAANWVIANHIPGIFNIKTDFNFILDIDFFTPD